MPTNVCGRTDERRETPATINGCIRTYTVSFRSDSFIIFVLTWLTLFFAFVVITEIYLCDGTNERTFKSVRESDRKQRD